MEKGILTDPNTMCIYTDGSGINGKIEGVAYSSTIEQMRHKHLGNDTTHNVFAAEVEAIAMAGKMIMELETNQRYKRCMIFVDSQAAITVVEKAKRQSGQEAIKSVLDNIESIKLQNPKMEMRVVWIPGRKGIEGNEKADQAAKQATEEHHDLANNRNSQPQPSAMKAARNAVIIKHINQ